MNSENEIKMVQVTEQVDTHDQDIQIYPQIVNERVETHEDAKVVVEEQNIQIDPQIVSEPVETHEDAKVVVEEQNIQIDPQIDEELNEPHVSKKVRLHEEQFVAIDTPHVSKKVCLHENAQEANEGQTVETHESAQVSVQEQIIKIEPPNTTLGVYVPYPHFADLHPNGSKWKVKARLVRMVEVMNPLLPGVTLRLVCLDEQGDAMEAIVWPEEVEYFRHHLYEGQVYLFRGVDVVPADDKYNFVPCCFKMSFTDDTRVEHVFIKCDKTPLHWDFLIRLQDIHHFTHKYVQLIDVVGLVVNVTQSRQTQNRNFMIRDVVLLNKSMTFVRLTLWNEFAMRDGMRLLDNLHSNQVLFATGLKVDYFHGPYLCTCMKSKLYVNHSFRTDGILEWLAKDRSAQKLVAWNRTHGFSLPQALIISNAKRIRIKQFAFMPNVQYYRIIGRIEKIYVEHLWIDLCKSCLKQVEDQYGWFVCTHCGQDDVQSVTRYNVKMIVRDSTGSMELLLKDKKAEFILQCVAPYLKELLSKDNGLQMLKDYIAQYYGRAYVFIISAPETVCLDHCASVVTFVLKVDWTEEFSYLFKGMSRTGNTTMRSS